ncbi:MAG: hypothetical protein R3F17_15620 [Planctomycetota bacterium]
MRIESAGVTHLYAAAGDSVPYQIYVETDSAAHQGLAMFAMDLVYSGGDLTQVTPSLDVASFVSPLGVNNPAGYGGTPHLGDLLQVGGAQNTIKNSFAPQPTGTVALSLAMPGSPLLVGSGSVVAPLIPGIYTLEASNLFANVVDAASTGNPYWKVVPCAPGNLSGLTIEVLDCAPTVVCAGTTNSMGCTASVGWSGVPSASGGSGLTIQATDLLNEVLAVYVWHTAPGPLPAYNTNLCVAGGFHFLRLPGLSGGGGTPATTCAGSATVTLDSVWFAANALPPGRTVYIQALYRDPFHPTGQSVQLSPGLSFVVCP